jgi:hypothetical protein
MVLKESRQMAKGSANGTVASIPGRMFGIVARAEMARVLFTVFNE